MLDTCDKCGKESRELHHTGTDGHDFLCADCIRLDASPPAPRKRYGDAAAEPGWQQVVPPIGIYMLLENDWKRLQQFLKATLTEEQYNRYRELEIIPSRREA